MFTKAVKLFQSEVKVQGSSLFLTYPSWSAHSSRCPSEGWLQIPVVPVRPHVGQICTTISHWGESLHVPGSSSWLGPMVNPPIPLSGVGQPCAIIPNKEEHWSHVGAGVFAQIPLDWEQQIGQNHLKCRVWANLGKSAVLPLCSSGEERQIHLIPPVPETFKRQSDFGQKTFEWTIFLRGKVKLFHFNQTPPPTHPLWNEIN